MAVPRQRSPQGSLLPSGPWSLSHQQAWDPLPSSLDPRWRELGGGRPSQHLIWGGADSPGAPRIQAFLVCLLKELLVCLSRQVQISQGFSCHDLQEKLKDKYRNKASERACYPDFHSGHFVS